MNNTKYQVRFVAQAEVEILLEVSAENQTEGLVLAHDLVSAATPEQAKVTTIIGETMKLVSFDRVAGSQSVPSRKITQAESSFKITAFADKDCEGSQLVQTTAESLLAAKARLQGFLAGIAGSGRIEDDQGSILFTENANRGGWEVEVWLDASEVSTQANPSQRVSWIASKVDAVQVALSKLALPGVSKINVMDYTNRKDGPTLWKQLK